MYKNKFFFFIYFHYFQNKYFIIIIIEKTENSPQNGLYTRTYRIVLNTKNRFNVDSRRRRKRAPQAKNSLNNAPEERILSNSDVPYDRSLLRFQCKLNIFTLKNNFMG